MSEIIVHLVSQNEGHLTPKRAEIETVPNNDENFLIAEINSSNCEFSVKSIIPRLSVWHPQAIALIFGNSFIDEFNASH